MPKNQTDRMIDRPYSARTGGGIINVTGGSTGGSGVSDHGLLTGLGDDDHPHYLNTTRGDARYIAATRLLTAGAGLEGGGDLSADRTFALSTPGTLSATSTNTATGNHTHVITASEDVGTSPAASLLKSTGSGGLTLGTLSVKGSVDITNNGDLTVGANVLFVDASQVNVGINCSPDPQFALDVNGPARATYFIGPHAIQLKGVLLLAHYDGRQPFETNETGEPNGHMGQVGTVTGSASYRAGMFGTKALTLGPATTNLLTNGNFETFSSGVGTSWNTYNTGTAAGNRYQDSRAMLGSYCQRLVRTGGAAGDRWGISQAVGAITGTAASMSVWVKVLSYSAGAIVKMYGDYSGGPFGQIDSITVDDTHVDTWVRLTVSSTIDSGDTLNYYVWVEGGNADVLVDCAQVEAKAYPTPFAASSRSAVSYLTYPISGNINATRGTVMAWVWLDGWSSNILTLWAAGNGASQLEAIVDSGAYLSLRVNGSNRAAVANFGTTYANGWAHVAFTWDCLANTCAVYLNGVQAATGVTGGAGTIPALHATTLGVGYSPSWGTTGTWNGQIDDFCILDRVAPADEIRSVYESDAPVFAESSRFSFRATPTGMVWADDEGLWMRAPDGTTVLGVYGGDSTKSWGGMTLAQGDLLLGDSSNHMLWDDSATKLILTGGGGSVKLDNDGLWFNAPSTQQDSASVRWLVGSTLYSMISTYGASGTANLILDSRRSGSGTAYLTLQAWNGSAAAAKIELSQNSSGVNAVTVTGPTTFASAVTMSSTLAVTGVLTAQDGSAAAPAIRSASRSNTGIYFPAGADAGTAEVSIAINGSQKATLTQANGLMMATSPGAQVYASGFHSNPGFNQNSSGATTLDCASGQGVYLKVAGTTIASVDATSGMLFSTSGLISFMERSTTPGSPSSGIQARMYMKADKLVLVFNDGGTVRYKYLELNGTSTTWTHTTTAP